MCVCVCVQSTCNVVSFIVTKTGARLFTTIVYRWWPVTGDHRWPVVVEDVWTGNAPMLVPAVRRTEHSYLLHHHSRSNACPSSLLPTRSCSHRPGRAVVGTVVPYAADDSRSCSQRGYQRDVRRTTNNSRSVERVRRVALHADDDPGRRRRRRPSRYLSVEYARRVAL